MVWYGAGDGAKRLRFRDMVNASVSRLQCALPCSVSLVRFELQDNSEYDTVKSFVYNPLSQDEVIAKINAEEANGDLALSIISTWHLTDLTGVTVCDQLKGLVLFGNPNLSKAAITAFLARCPNLEALVLAFDVEATFVQSVFEANLLPKLRFLEVSEANDHAVAAMASSPNLEKLIVRTYDLGLTNEGFGRMIEAGGGQSLGSVILNIVKSRPLCKTVTKNYLMATLPVFCAGKGKESHLQQMILGKKVLSQVEITMKAIISAAAKPFAVVPVELMTFAQLQDALENRGVNLPTPRSTANFRQTLINVGFTIETETAIQAKRKAESESKPGALLKRPAKKTPAAPKPFAVVPVELMTLAQLMAALDSRGVPLPTPRSTANFRKTLIDGGFTLENEAAIQAKKKAESESKPSRKPTAKVLAAAKAFAVVPVDLMTFAQLLAALENRGVALPYPRTTTNFRQALNDYGFTLEGEAAVQKRKKAESESKPASPKRPAKKLPAAVKPFAVVPVELMAFAQLVAALENRGVALPTPRTTENFRLTLIHAGFTLEKEAAIQARLKVESESKPKSRKRPLTSVAWRMQASKPKTRK
jgi:hypothetical protein